MALASTAAAIVVVCGILLARLWSTLTFMMDDLLQFEAADRLGLSTELLLQNVFQHFAPVNRLGHLILLRWGDADLHVMAVVAVVIVGIMLTVTAWLAAELGLNLTRRLALVILVGGALSVMDSAVWTDTAFHILGALTATYLILAMHLRGLRTGKPAWHVASVAAFAAGLLVQERVGFALPLAVLVDTLLLLRGEPWGWRLRAVWSVRVPLGAMAVIGLLAGWWIKQNYTVTPVQGPDLSSVTRTGVTALANFQFPQLTGFQPDDYLPTAATLVVLVLIAAAAWAVCAMNPLNRGPVLFFFAVFGLYWGFLIFSPILADDTVLHNAARPQNHTYLTVPAYLALLSLHGPPGWQSRWRGLPPSRQRAARALAVVTVLALVSAAGSAFTDRHWNRYRTAHAYWAGLAATESIWSDRSVTVVPTLAPRALADGWAESLGQTYRLLPFFDRTWRPGPVAARTVVFTPEGTLQDVVLVRVAATERVGADPADGSPSCLRPTSTTDSFAFGLPGPAPTQPVVARLRYSTDVNQQLWAYPSAGGGLQTHVAPTPLAAGDGEELIQLPQDGTDAIVLTGLAPASTTCVHDLDVLVPRAVDTSSGSTVCRLLDAYGRAGAVASCTEA